MAVINDKRVAIIAPGARWRTGSGGRSCVLIGFMASKYV